MLDRLNTEKEREKKKININYTALFVDDIEGLKKLFPPMHEKHYYHHSTIAYRPKSAEGLEIGRKHKLKIIGRAHDEKCDALLVVNVKSNNEHPHITLSTTKDTSPVYSNELIKKAIENNSVEYLENTLTIDTTEGYFDGKDVITKVEI